MTNQIIILRRVFRGLLVFLAIVPLIFWQPFYNHFFVYLTGTVVNGIITHQWRMVVFSIVLFAVFLIPLNYRRRAKWANYGLAGAFFVSLFIEMYGIPLTILFASKYFFTPGLALPRNVLEFSFLGVGLGLDHAMVYGAVLMIIGMGLIAFGWLTLYRQTKRPGFARTGLYSLSRIRNTSGSACSSQAGGLAGRPS